MRKPGVFLCALVIIFFMGFIYNTLFRGYSNADSHPAPLRTTSTSTPTFPVIGPQSEELNNLLKMIEWPLAPPNVSLEFSTHPKTSQYFIINPRATYVIGESLEVLIIAKDHKGRAKNYGGDFFYVKLHSLSLKAGVSGSVTDHHNGSYTARFILQWSGETMISVRLMHSSELIAILHQQRDTRPDKVLFKGYFEKNGIREEVACNVDLPGQDVCEYYDQQNHEKWVCQRPKKLPCDSYREHSAGENRNIQSQEQKPFFSASLINQEIPSNLGSLNVLPQKNVTSGTNVPCIAGLRTPNPSGFYYQDVWKSLVCSNKQFNNHTMAAKCLAGKIVYMFGDSTMRQWWEYLVAFIPSTNVPCIAGLRTPNPSGFYYQDVWKSLVCSNKQFNNHTMAAKCLAGKIVYMFGDSTMRQWWEYLVAFIPTLKKIDLHTVYNTGPILATDAEFNYLVQWRAHQKPLRMDRTAVRELRFIASELDILGNRKGTIILITCWSHLITYPVGVYINRLHHIREAVVRLLDRSPETKILIKSANTGYLFEHGSDWLSLQLDTLMKAMFSKLPVAILDVWEMTACHREPEHIHPKMVVVKNEIDFMLSFICPH